MKNYVIGLMSGTSLDGIDAALVKIEEIDGEITNADLVSFLEKKYEPEIRGQLLRACDPDSADVPLISTMNMYLGELFAEAVNELLANSGLSRDDILLVSSHGHTVFHQPNPLKINGTPITSTLQIGDIAVIAERTGITTAGDFRTRDMAAGGQGAPLVPYVDELLFRDSGFGRILLNIGGIANITVLPKHGEGTVVGYDTGPGNMVMDMFVHWATEGKQTFDRDGALARSGTVNQKWLGQLLKNEYFTMEPPKTTGREDFGRAFAKKLWAEASESGINLPDRIATVTELTARTICLEITRVMKKIQIHELLVSGGGSYNHFLMERLACLLPGLKVDSTNAYHIDANAKEAIVFAVLGYQCYRKRVNTIPSVTGAKQPVIMGKIAW